MRNYNSFKNFDLKFTINECAEEYSIFVYSQYDVDIDFEIYLNFDGSIKYPVDLSPESYFAYFVALESNIHLSSFSESKRLDYVEDLKCYVIERANEFLSENKTNMATSIYNELVATYGEVAAEKYEIQIKNKTEISVTYIPDNLSLGYFNEAITALECIQLQEFICILNSELKSSYRATFHEDKVRIFKDNKILSYSEYEDVFENSRYEILSDYMKGKEFYFEDLVSPYSEIRAFAYKSIFNNSLPITQEISATFSSGILTDSLLSIYEYALDNELDSKNKTHLEMIELRYSEEISI